MIKIEVRSYNSLPFYISVKGHAGEDAVCAGVSAIIQTAGEYLVKGLKLSWDRTDWKLLTASGLFVVELHNRERLENERSMARDWLLNLVLMLHVFSQKHGDNIVWTEVEVK